MSKLNHAVTAISLALSLVKFTHSAQGAAAPDKLIGVHSARVMSQSFPWVAQEAGLFRSTI
jgi:hypothetical protein